MTSLVSMSMKQLFKEEKQMVNAVCHKYFRKYFPLTTVDSIRGIAKKDRAGLEILIHEFSDEMLFDNEKIFVFDAGSSAALDSIVMKFDNEKDLSLYELYLLNEVLYRYKYIWPFSSVVHPSLAYLSAKKKCKYFPVDLLEKWRLEWTEMKTRTVGKSGTGKTAKFIRPNISEPEE